MLNPAMSLRVFFKGMMAKDSLISPINCQLQKWQESGLEWSVRQFSNGVLRLVGNNK